MTIKIISLYQVKDLKEGFTHPLMASNYIAIISDCYYYACDFLQFAYLHSFQRRVIWRDGGIDDDEENKNEDANKERKKRQKKKAEKNVEEEHIELEQQENEKEIKYGKWKMERTRNL